MESKTLSILVPTIRTRRHHLDNLTVLLEPQMHYRPDVELLVENDGGEACIGEKRNALIDRAEGKYTVFVDDDDWIAPDYVRRVLKATESRPDVITFDMERYIDGKLTGYQVMRLGNGYRIDESDPALKRYAYPPTHLCPMRREITKTVRFLPANAGEDTFWQDEIRPRLTTEANIPAVLYRYLYRTSRLREVTNVVRRVEDWEIERVIDAEFARMIAFPPINLGEVTAA